MVHKVAAHGDIFLSLSLSRQALESEAKQTCINLLPEWRGLTPADVEVSEISGGITNILWKVAPVERLRLEPVVLRVFGKQTDKIIDRDNEQKVLLRVNKAGFGAQVLATFENGRIEAFLYMRPLKPEEMVTRQMASRIARRVKHLHAVDMQEPAQPDLFPTILHWLQQARQLDFSDDSAKAAAHAAIDFDGYEREVGIVQQAALSLGMQPSFAHNDLLSGNILVPNEEKEGEIAGEVQLIDFEYGGSTFAAFDIGNHFNEYAGFECEYSRFPDHDHITHFAREYLEEASAGPVGEAAVKQLVAECYAMSLASHQFWGIWSVLQARYSPIEFDYMGYSGLRWQEYFRRKEEFLGHARTGPSWQSGAPQQGT